MEWDDNPNVTPFGGGFARQPYEVVTLYRQIRQRKAYWQQEQQKADKAKNGG